jgi:hypothetical protein
MSLVLNLVEEYSKKSKKKNYWKGSPFESLLELSSDERGKLGEDLMKRLCNEVLGYESLWEGDKNVGRKDGSIWDILIKQKRTEIKFAMRGSSTPMWQHEKIKEEPIWDKIIFIDIDYDGVWFTIQNYGDIPYGDEKHKITNTKSTQHLGDWKFDLSLVRISKLHKMGYSYRLDIKKPDYDQLKCFFDTHFSE